MKIIYKPKGRAAEYAPFAVNPYLGKCEGGCKYCYVPRIPDGGNFKGEPRSKEDYLERLAHDIKRLPDHVPPILFSFTHDPYQPIEEELRLVRQSIRMLHAAGVPVMILTKFPHLAMRDFDLLTPHDWFGVTLTFNDPEKSKEWEPGADLPAERIRALREARRRGIQTWASLEPVIDLTETRELIRRTHEYVDLYRVGMLNYHKTPRPVNWPMAGIIIIRTLNFYNANYKFKKDLKELVYKERASVIEIEYSSGASEFPEILDPPLRDPGRFKQEGLR
ncbi:MAG: hypothetical protein JW984_15130 [Deltaproteobacteria bacterium]|uniref:Radical SAM core domain-containing protein n=1 Tax=Candidatus Zymogenus saltonus TaxID=2844893 RepID=A0A9D8KIX3_9DELT|nr:hypothetical protein [Candidatus Zymogenus saltonus]